jgi:phage terminase large subunit
LIDLSQINPKQRLFFKAKSRHIAYGGSRGGGKSWAMRTLFILMAMNYSGLKLLLLRRTLPELRENHILPLLSMIGGFSKYSAEEKAFQFPNGSRLKLGYCDNERDIYQYQGQEYDVIGFEESTLFTWAMIQFILTCNRSTRTDFKPRAYYTMNPGGVSHAEHKRLFIDRQFREGEDPDDYLFIQAKLYDNPILMNNNPEYVKTLEALPEQLRKAHLDGDWDVFIGQVFSEFSRDKHVVEPFEIPPNWKRYRSLDWGYSKPYAVYWGAVDYDGVLYIYRELYGCKDLPDTGTQETAEEVAKKIRKLEKGEEVFGVADPACWAKTGHTGPTIAEQLRISGVMMHKADNDRIQGKMQVHKRLKHKGIKIFSNCTHLIRTLPALIYDEHKVEDVDTDQEDHAYDSIRYLCMARPYKTDKPEEYKKRDGYADEESKPSWMVM